jgi:outer membrane lipoprotein-sorting protein
MPKTGSLNFSINKGRKKMKRYFSLFLLAFFLLALVASPGFSQKASDILEKMIEAQGGRKVLESIKDITLSGTFEWEKMSGPFTQYQKAPNKFRQEAEVMGMKKTDAFDGEIGWSIEAGQLRELAGKDAEDAKSGAFGYAAILYPEKYGISYVLKGKEKIEGHDYFVLEQTIPGGTPITHFIDAQTYLVYKTESPGITDREGVMRKTVTLMLDYRKADGVMIAHSLTIGPEGWETVTIKFTKVSFNTGLEDSLFKMKK